MKLRIRLYDQADYYDAAAIGNKLKELRTSQKLSYHGLSRLTGLNYKTIRKMEHGEYVAAYYIRKLFAYYNIDPFQSI